MKRTLIITIETTGEDAYRTLETAEEGVLEQCDNIANSYLHCSVNAEICVNALPNGLISELCNNTAAWKDAMPDHEIVLSIQELLDGVEWNSETLCAIETILNANGYRIRDLNDRDANHD